MGFNLKITDMQAACGLSQLKKLNKFIKIRRNNFHYLHKKFSLLKEYFILPQKTANSDPSWFGFPLTVNSKKIIRNDLIKFLDQKKIGTRLLFSGNVTKQPYMLNQNYRISGNLENTDRVLHDTFWLGVYPGLGKVELNYICSTIKDYIDRINQKN